MAGPIRIFRYFSDADLQTLFASLKQRMLTGQITATGGAGKSSSQEYMKLEDELRSIQLEFDIRGGVKRAQRVEQLLVRPFSEDPLGDGFPLG